MTLVTTVAAPWGIWQCSDHRLTVGHTLYDDWSPKHLALLCPDGRGLVSYTGVGELGFYTQAIGVHADADADSLPTWLTARNANAGSFVSAATSDWVLQALSGETRTIAESVEQLCHAATATRGFWRSPHPTAFPIGAFVGSQAFFVTVANGGWIGTGPGSPKREAQFRYSLMNVNGPGVAFAGAHDAVTQEERDRISKIIQRPPRNPEDYFALLASVNRRAAQNGQFSTYISEQCTVSYLPPDGPIRTHVETWGIHPPPEFSVGVRTIMNGINLHSLTKDTISGWQQHIAEQKPTNALDDPG